MMDITKISEALQIIRPNAEWVLRGHSIEGLEWLDNKQNEPTKDEIEQAIEKIKIDKDGQDAAQAAKKAVAEAKLAALGLTVDDLKALGL